MLSVSKPCQGKCVVASWINLSKKYLHWLHFFGGEAGNPERNACKECNSSKFLRCSHVVLLNQGFLPV